MGASCPRYEGLKGKALNGWAVSGITSFQTGFPISIKSNADAELMNSFDFELPGKPNLVAPFHAVDPRKHNELRLRCEVLCVARLHVDECESGLASRKFIAHSVLWSRDQ